MACRCQAGRQLGHTLPWGSDTDQLLSQLGQAVQSQAVASAATPDKQADAPGWPSGGVPSLTQAWAETRSSSMFWRSQQRLHRGTARSPSLPPPPQASLPSRCTGRQTDLKTPTTARVQPIPSQHPCTHTLLHTSTQGTLPPQHPHQLHIQAQHTQRHPSASSPNPAPSVPLGPSERPPTTTQPCPTQSYRPHRVPGTVRVQGARETGPWRLPGHTPHMGPSGAGSTPTGSPDTLLASTAHQHLHRR